VSTWNLGCHSIPNVFLLDVICHQPKEGVAIIKLPFHKMGGYPWTPQIPKPPLLAEKAHLRSLGSWVNIIGDSWWVFFHYS